MSKKIITLALLVIILVAGIATVANASDKVEVNTGIDFYNRYVWRGIDIASTPSIQPSISVGCCHLEFGVWGAYTLSNQASESDEIDFWLSYSRELNNGIGISLIATDYYYPNAGIKFFNFNNYDDMKDDTIPDPGAHTIEMGLSVSGPESFPVTFSAYVNVYNDGGNNTYFQIDYPFTVGETELSLFCGATGGSTDNPDYYGAEEFSVINLGVSVNREIKVTESFSLPLNMSFILNPKAEIAYLLGGLSF